MKSPEVELTPEQQMDWLKDQYQALPLRDPRRKQLQEKYFGLRHHLQAEEERVTRRYDPALGGPDGNSLADRKAREAKEGKGDE